jgi:E3 ubiquitin-protein transferase RMND5
MKRPFVEIASILTALKQDNCFPALEWAQAHADRLETNLIFQLHRLQYVRMIHEGQTNEAFDYARKFFSNFLQTENREVQRLMAAILFAGKLNDSPYADLNDVEALKSDVMFSVSREYCRILNMTAFSPLLAWYITYFMHTLTV